MPKKEVPIGFLQQYLPPGTVADVTSFLLQYKVHLTITRQRQSILGDYRHKTDLQNHRISINGNLNPFAFLITLLHELAHLLTFEQYGSKVNAHGTEWKKVYGHLLHQFVQQKKFPTDIENELLQSLRNPAASSCAEDNLLRVLRKYDKGNENMKMLEELTSGAVFRTKDGRVFKKGEKLRKRFKCLETSTGKLYLFSPVYEVLIVEPVKGSNV